MGTYFDPRRTRALRPSGLKASTPNKVLAEVVLAQRGREVGGAWQTIEGEAKRGQAHTDFAHRVIKVPNGATEVARLVRAHELAHLAVSPESDEQTALLKAWLDERQVPWRAYEVAEELRVNAVIQGMGYDIAGLADGTEPATALALAERGDIEAYNEAMAFAVAIYGTKAQRPFASALNKAMPDWREPLKAITKICRAFVADNNKAMLTSRIMRDGDSTAPGASCLEYGHYLTARLAEQIALLLITPTTATEAGLQAGIGKADEFGHAPGQFAPLLFDDERPSVAVKGASAHRRKVATDRGQRVAYPSRAITDPQRRMFAGRTRTKGGVMLIDCSGSMDIPAEAVAETLKALPLATIIGYSHRPRSAGEPNAFILSSDGLIVPDIEETSRRGSRIGNGVDLPALRHAIGVATGLVKAGETTANHRLSTARAVQPLVWVFDGQATDCGDYPAPDEALAEIAGLVIKHGVIIVPTLAEGVKALLSPTMSKAKAGGRVGRHLPPRFGGTKGKVQE